MMHSVKNYRHTCPSCGLPAPTFAGHFRQHLKDGMLPFWFETYRKSHYCPGSGRPVDGRVEKYE